MCDFCERIKTMARAILFPDGLAISIASCRRAASEDDEDEPGSDS